MEGCSEMRRGIVLLVLFAAAIVGFAPMQGAAQPISTPCANLDEFTAKLDSPGTLNGTSGADILIGSTGADIINGKGGDDIICGNGGADLIDGGTGDDRIEATDGSTILGGIGNDWLYALNGATAKGGAGNDEILLENAAAGYGESGNDYIRNLEGVPTVDCGSGSDTYIDETTQPSDVAPAARSCENKYTT